MGIHNDGYDDENYDYILQGDEILKERYMLKHRMGKGSFGQVVCAFDQERKIDVAVKIIKSRKPFLVQAKTEIDILNKINEKDPDEESNIVRLLDHFMFRNHQCLVFEILSFNLYELLKNTK
jgi:dual specificity tyrosine-phosphorylation-regulated kinase 1